jgi:hypothetical protein
MVPHRNQRNHINQIDQIDQRNQTDQINSVILGEASLACRSFLAKAALPSQRDKFQRETLYSSRRLNHQYIHTNQIVGLQDPISLKMS